MKYAAEEIAFVVFFTEHLGCEIMLDRSAN